MPDRCHEIAGTRIFECSAEGARLEHGGDALELMSAAWSHKASLVAIPAVRLSDEFFQLKSGVAGEFVQKFVTYGLHLAIIGDISSYLDRSPALRDFVHESNKGRHVWFVADTSQLAAKLSLVR